MNVKQIKGAVLIDTNVLIYATLDNDPRRDRSLEAIHLRKKADCEIYISTQNLAEMYPNLIGPKNNPPDSPEMARAKINSIANLAGITILPIDITVTQKALELCEQHKVTRQNYFDMQLVALMQIENIATILTENTKDFSGICGLKAISPFA